MLAASLFFLGAKSTEFCRNIDEIIICFLMLFQKDVDTDPLNNEALKALKSAVILKEQLILRALAFDTSVETPHTHLLNIARY